MLFFCGKAEKQEKACLKQKKCQHFEMLWYNEFCTNKNTHDLCEKKGVFSLGK